MRRWRTGAQVVVWCGLAAAVTACGDATMEEGEGEQIECMVGDEGDDTDAIVIVGELSAETRCYVVQGTIDEDDDEEDVYRFSFAADTEIDVFFALTLENEDAEAKLTFEDNDALEFTSDCEDDDPMFDCERSFDKAEFDVTVDAEDEGGGYVLQVVLR